MKEITGNQRKIMRRAAFKKANKYYGIYQDYQSPHYQDIREDCLEISLTYFGLYFICLKQDIEKKYGFTFQAYKGGNMKEKAFSGIALLKDWSIKKNASGPSENMVNPFYKDCNNLFKSEEITHALERLINNFQKSNITQVFELDNLEVFLAGLNRFKNEVLDNFSFLFYRVRNHLVHAGKNINDVREKEIMEDMCTVLSKYTRTIEDNCRHLRI